jgi:biopolymer transport protein ExbD
MSTTATRDDAIGDAPAVEAGPIIPRRTMGGDAEIDMTPMIDCVFLLNIFFILTFNADPAQSAALAPSVTGTPLDPRTAVIVTMAEGPDRTAIVYMGQGKQGSPLPADEAAQRDIVLRHLQDGAAAGKTVLAIQAEQGVKEGDVDRIAGLVNEVEGMSLHFPVREIQE